MPETKPGTKIICTIGPSSSQPRMLEDLIRSGMDVARLNFSHGSHPQHGRVISDIREVSRRLAKPVAILQDLSGPKIRTGEIAGGRLELVSGSIVTMEARSVPSDPAMIPVSYGGLPRDVRPGDPILLADGAMELEVVEATDLHIQCRVIIGGILGSRKGINLPTRSIAAPGLTGKDREDLGFGITQGVDYVALSFVRDASDIGEARKFMGEHGASIPVIAKIEKHEALGNIDQIISEADGIMVARGDLGVEIPLERVPQVQKMLIRKCNDAGKPVITATQMLLSMVDSPRPTRAEVADVANAVLDGTDAVMLSEESAIGKHPVEVVRTMARIALEAEASSGQGPRTHRHGSDVPEVEAQRAVADAACDLAEALGAVCIVAPTQTGGTARLVSRNRPRRPVLAPTPLEDTYRRLALVWGVVPILTPAAKDTDEIIDHALSHALESGLAKRGDRVVITAGVPFGVPGTTNLVRVGVV